MIKNGEVSTKELPNLWRAQLWWKCKSVECILEKNEKMCKEKVFKTALCQAQKSPKKYKWTSTGFLNDIFLQTCLTMINLVLFLVILIALWWIRHYQVFKLHSSSFFYSRCKYLCIEDESTFVFINSYLIWQMQTNAGHSFIYQSWS